MSVIQRTNCEHKQLDESRTKRRKSDSFACSSFASIILPLIFVSLFFLHTQTNQLGHTERIIRFLTKNNFFFVCCCMMLLHERTKAMSWQKTIRLASKWISFTRKHPTAHTSELHSIRKMFNSDEMHHCVRLCAENNETDFFLDTKNE